MKSALKLNQTLILMLRHLAALANMLYMEMNNTVLELRAENDAHNNCHYSLAVGLNNKFYYLICENDDDSKTQTSAQTSTQTSSQTQTQT